MKGTEAVGWLMILVVAGAGTYGMWLFFGLVGVALMILFSLPAVGGAIWYGSNQDPTTDTGGRQSKGASGNRGRE